MRCPKCQYLGFEPSPRCKNCGYDFSFGTDDLPSLTIAPAPEAMADFDLQVFNESAPGAKSSMPSNGFDLDDLLAHGRSEPALVMERGPMGAATASAVAPPPAEDVLRVIRHEEPSIAKAKPQPPPPMTPARRSAPAPAAVTTELPLFMQVMSEPPAQKPAPDVRPGMPLTIEKAISIGEPFEAPATEDVDDRPLVQVPAVPRPPLAVRRTTPDPARLRAKYARATAKAESSKAGDLLRGIDDPEPNQPAAHEPTASRLSAEPTPGSLPSGWLQGVSAGKRLSAAALDVMLLGAIDAAIVWFTLSVCGLRPTQAYLLPLIPIVVFFLLVDGGYLVLFTAACGQTIGKMAAGIRVVGTTTGAVINDRITLGQAVARSVGAIASCIPLGAGFWMSLAGDGRALHDRIAHTRVVRA